MSTWDGTSWVEDRPAPVRSDSRFTRWAATAVMIVGLAGLLIPFGVVEAKAPSSYSPTLAVTFSAAYNAPTADSAYSAISYVISGCGYDASLGNVTVVVYTPVAVSWTGRTPDASGCISVDNFSTQGSGGYRIDAWQHVRNKDVVVATTNFSL